MFAITSDTKIGPFSPFKASSLKWIRNIDNFSDSAFITIPTMCLLQGMDRQYSYVPTAQAFTEGMPVEIKAGYDGNNVTRFKGFVKRINLKVPTEIECEGYAYLFRPVRFSRGYMTRTTVKRVIEDVLSAGGLTGKILLHPKFQDITFEPFTFKNYSGIEVLEFLNKQYKVTIFFDFDQLYIGLRETLWNQATTNIVKHKLGWNVIKDDKLLFNAVKEFAQVNIMAVSKNIDGTRNKGINKLQQPGGTKIERLLSRDPNYLKLVAEQEKTLLTFKGYTGKITAFLEPYAQPSMSDIITDPVYAKRTGRYFIESVEGEITRTGGGRQIIGIGNTL